MRIHSLIAAATLLVAAPALAVPTVGMTVKDTGGADVGTVASIDGGNIVVDTGTNKVPVPGTSFTEANGGLLLAMTRAQLDSAFANALAEQKAKVTAAVTPGASVRGTQGKELGTVVRLEGEFVRVKGPTGEARIPLSGLALQADGLHFGMTAEEFADAVKASMPKS